MMWVLDVELAGGGTVRVRLPASLVDGIAGALAATAAAYPQADTITVRGTA